MRFSFPLIDSEWRIAKSFSDARMFPLYFSKQENRGKNKGICRESDSKSQNVDSSFPSWCALACCRQWEKSSSSSCAYLHNLINQFFSFFLPASSSSSSLYSFTLYVPHVALKNAKIIETATNVSQPDKQQPPTIDENCATGSSNNSQQQTANGDIPQQHAPPLQVSSSAFCSLLWAKNDNLRV